MQSWVDDNNGLPAGGKPVGDDRLSSALRTDSCGRPSIGPRFSFGWRGGVVPGVCRVFYIE